MNNFLDTLIDWVILLRWPIGIMVALLTIMIVVLILALGQGK